MSLATSPQIVLGQAHPVYSFNSSSAMPSDRQVEVKLNLASAKDSQGEFDESPRIQKVTYFHYMLDLDDAGAIVGGYFFRDSSRIDMLWLPLRPKLSGAEGHERGNPHVNVNEVLAIWRESVPEEVRAAWPVADPALEDRLSLDADSWQPLQIPGTAASSPDVAEENEAVVTGG